MKRKGKHILSGRLVQSYLSSIISISMLLFLAGTIALLAINAKSVSNHFRENIKITLILNEGVVEENAQMLHQELSSYPYVKEALYVSKEQGREEMVELLGTKFLELFEVDPIPISLELFLKANYTVADSLEVIEGALKEREEVREILYQESLLQLINSNLEKVTYFVFTLFALFLFVSFVLINNTVRLNLFSKRRVVYTMKLVGAKRSFIRKPFIKNAIWQGLLASLLAIAALLLILSLLFKQLPELLSIVKREMLIIPIAAMPVLGILLCSVSTFFVTNRLISMRDGEVYY